MSYNKVIELSLESWTHEMFISRRYKTKEINYAGKYTIVIDVESNKHYKATYNMKTGLINLLEVDY